MKSFQGRRLPDTMLGEDPVGFTPGPGDYWKLMSRKDPGVDLSPVDLKHVEFTEGQDPAEAARLAGNLTNQVWVVITPNHLEGLLSIHTVREESDGTISVRPGDGSSNSILVQFSEESWHGYIEHGVWNEC